MSQVQQVYKRSFSDSSDNSSCSNNSSSANRINVVEEKADSALVVNCTNNNNVDDETLDVVKDKEDCFCDKLPYMWKYGLHNLPWPQPPPVVSSMEVHCQKLRAKNSILRLQKLQLMRENAKLRIDVECLENEVEKSKKFLKKFVK